ncbi:carbon storage regulator [Pseudomonas sp.]|uniref:carbon storage regulator n=1 Tax=Pseudomonas sp. TaxID=306 RepID=UPI00299D0DA6|nr:carbon storage regulator [Pseudomonas sp.]MDX1368112.1 carbon storage regulator [Pseudomonas sp.]
MQAIIEELNQPWALLGCNTGQHERELLVVELDIVPVQFRGAGIDYPHDDFTTKEGIVMPHLMLTRSAGQSIVLTLAPDADPEKALLQFLRDGITVEISQIESSNVRVSIDAPRTIQILRNELIHRAMGCYQTRLGGGIDLAMIRWIRN